MLNSFADPSATPVVTTFIGSIPILFSGFLTQSLGGDVIE